jgi:hypothetical protein
MRYACSLMEENGGKGYYDSGAANPCRLQYLGIRYGSGAAPDSQPARSSPFDGRLPRLAPFRRGNIHGIAASGR